MRRLRFSVVLLTLLVILSSMGPLGQHGTEARKRDRRPTSRPDAVRPVSAEDLAATDEWYIVVLKPDAGDAGAFATATARSRGAVVRNVYRSALSGFSARLDATALAALKRDPKVKYVSKNFAVRAPESNPEPAQAFPPTGQTVPVGVERIQAPENPVYQVAMVTPGVDVDVAVIDTGIAEHPDLNIAGGYSCINGGSTQADYDDGSGHGTHVAGTIGAIGDNPIGIVGVAPGARLWAVKVLGADGSGSYADILCGIDWVTENADVIDVANMSLVTQFNIPLDTDDCGAAVQDPQHLAICASVEAGVTYVAGAGNDCADAAYYTPAAYPEVITVAAFADSDGMPGRYGDVLDSITCQYEKKVGKGKHKRTRVVGKKPIANADDFGASFSNYGNPVDLMAPGVQILSTYPPALADTFTNRPYVQMSGTSMAAPYVAGAAALIIAANPNYTPAQVMAELITMAERASITNMFVNYPWNFNRPYEYQVPILNVNPNGPWAFEMCSRSTTANC